MSVYVSLPSCFHTEAVLTEGAGHIFHLTGAAEQRDVLAGLNLGLGESSSPLSEHEAWSNAVDADVGGTALGETAGEVQASRLGDGCGYV